MSNTAATMGVDPQAKQVKAFKLQDRLFQSVTMIFALIVLASLVGILVSLAIEAMPSLKQFGPGFLWTEIWSVPDDEYGALISTYGTVVTSMIASSSRSR